VSTPSQCCHQPSAYRYYAVSHVLPSWFRTTSTAYSTQSLRAYCIPLSTMGFATFPLQSNLNLQEKKAEKKNFPATHFIPLEEYPSSAAASCHHDRYLHAVVESRLNTKAFIYNFLSTSRSYSTDELAMLSHRFQHDNTRSFHGLCSPSRSSIRRCAQDESCSNIPSSSSQWCLASETPPIKTEALIFGPQ